MKVHIWCPRASDSAIKIRDSLREKGIRAYKTRTNQSNKAFAAFMRRVKPGDLWVNWGPPYHIPNRFPGLLVLNGAQFLNKRDQLITLAHAGIAVPEVYDRPAAGRIGRSFRHQAGYDLMHNTGRDYYTQKLSFTREIRIHIYRGKSIHAGLKVPRRGFPNPHPWIRVYDAGWRIDYSRAKEIAKNRRDLAARAVAALGLDFGAVDIGVIKGNSMAVIEVNTAPGLDEGASVEAYVRHFMEEIR